MQPSVEIIVLKPFAVASSGGGYVPTYHILGF